MKSQNFEFLRPTWPDLATLAAFAEHTCRPRSVERGSQATLFRGAGGRIRLLQTRTTKPFQFNLNDLLNGAGFLQAVPRVVVSKLHAPANHGNHAAHGADIADNQAKYLLKETYDLGRWLAMTFAGV